MIGAFSPDSFFSSHRSSPRRRACESISNASHTALKENGPPPSGKWADIAVLEPVRNYKARHASTLLTFDAVVAALDKIEAQKKQAAE